MMRPLTALQRVACRTIPGFRARMERDALAATRKARKEREARTAIPVATQVDEEQIAAVVILAFAAGMQEGRARRPRHRVSVLTYDPNTGRSTRSMEDEHG